MNKIVRCAVPVVIATVVLFAIGMATRMPAIRLGINFGLHAVLAAFFYGLVVAVFEIKTAHAYPVVVGSAVFGAVLGMMSPVMTVAAILPAVAYLVVFLVMHGGKGGSGSTGSSSAPVIGGTVFAAFAYVGTVVGGELFSGYTPGVADLPFLMLSIGLGLLGSLAGAFIAEKIGPAKAR